MAARSPSLSSSASKAAVPHDTTQGPGEEVSQQQEQQPQPNLRSTVPDNDATEDSNPAAEQERPRPPFAPFFTLVEDVNSSEHFHPTVHYIFSDDDTDLLTDAALRALSGPSASSSSSQGGVGSGDGGSQQLRRSRDNYRDNDDDNGHNNRSREFQDPPSRASQQHQRGIRERYVVVDIGPSGDTVTSTHSFNADWQPLGAELTTAPTWEAEDVLKSDQQQKAGLMLRIEGVQSFDDPEEERREVTAEMLERFEKRMVTLRKVVAGS